jgi:hypothetical protein
MNKDQVESLLTKLIIASVTGLATKYGFSNSEVQDVSVDLSSAIFGIGVIIFSHKWNKTT